MYFSLLRVLTRLLIEQSVPTFKTTAEDKQKVEELLLAVFHWFLTTIRCRNENGSPSRQPKKVNAVR